MRKGFTLIELMVVVVIIGVLATFAVPQYFKLTTKAKFTKAKHAIGLLAQAEKLHYGEYDEYGVFAAGGAEAAIGEDRTGMKVADTDGDADFTYSGNAAGVIQAASIGAIGGCPANTTVSYNIDTGAWTPVSGMPGCAE